MLRFGLSTKFQRRIIFYFLIFIDSNKLGDRQTSIKRTMLSCRSSWSIFISRSAVIGKPSFSWSIRMSFIATNSDVALQLALKTSLKQAKMLFCLIHRKTECESKNLPECTLTDLIDAFIIVNIALKIEKTILCNDVEFLNFEITDIRKFEWRLFWSLTLGCHLKCKSKLVTWLIISAHVEIFSKVAMIRQKNFRFRTSIRHFNERFFLPTTKRTNQ